MNPPDPLTSATPTTDNRPPAGRDTTALWTAALCLVIAAVSWYLLRELAMVLRPLLLAVLLGYVVLPIHLRLRQRMTMSASVALMVGATVGLLYLLMLMIYGSVVELSEDLPFYMEQLRDLLGRGRDRLLDYVPQLAGGGPDPERAQADAAAKVSAAALSLVNATAGGLVEALIVGIYLIFLLMEAGRLPRRIQSGFDAQQAERIFDVIGRINTAMASYLRVKVWASLVLAAPATLVLWVFGVRFAFLWGVLTFFGNFIPYLGSIVSCSLPIALAFLQPNLTWQPFVVAALLVGIHSSSAYLIEPAMTGRAVDLSPLAILLALAFWGQCWGLPGLLLAVPLTVMVKIILENVPFTRPFARLLAEE